MSPNPLGIPPRVDCHWIQCQRRPTKQQQHQGQQRQKQKKKKMCLFIDLNIRVSYICLMIFILHCLCYHHSSLGFTVQQQYSSTKIFRSHDSRINYSNTSGDDSNNNDDNVDSESSSTSSTRTKLKPTSSSSTSSRFLLRRRDRIMNVFGIHLLDEVTKNVQRYRRNKKYILAKKSKKLMQQQQVQVLETSTTTTTKTLVQNIQNDKSKNNNNNKPPPLKVHIKTLQQLNDHWDDIHFLNRLGSKNLKMKKTMNGESDSSLSSSISASSTTSSSSTPIIDYTGVVRSACVMGDTQIIGSKHHLHYTHPVAELMHERQRTYYRPSGNVDSKTTTNHNHNDTMTASSIDRLTPKIALAVEGGGMRGCISAGMVCAIHYLNLTHTIDRIYGSSAGTIVSAYVLSNQLPWYGPELYYDCLPTSNQYFIDTKRLLRSIGLGLIDPRLYKDVLIRRESGGKPVLNLHYLLNNIVQHDKELDWNMFVKNQYVQPLNIIVSGLKSETSIALNYQNGAYQNLMELSNAMHASCLLPGIAGPLMNLNMNEMKKDKMKQVEDEQQEQVDNRSNSNSVPTLFRSSSTTTTSQPPKYLLRNNVPDSNGVDDNSNTMYEPLADALLYEPIPYRSALQDNATHVLVIRSRPDGVDVTGKGGFIENRIFKRYFIRKNQLPNIYERLRQQIHKKIYGEDIIILNEHANCTKKTDMNNKDDYNDSNKNNINDYYYYYPNGTRMDHQLMTIALEPNSTEVSRLELNREAIFEGMRRGFARAYDCLVPDVHERGKGWDRAQLYFPNEILNYNPNDYSSSSSSTNDNTKYNKKNNNSNKMGNENGSSSSSSFAQSAFEQYLRSTQIIPEAWRNYYAEYNITIPTDDKYRYLPPPPPHLLLQLQQQQLQQSSIVSSSHPPPTVQYQKQQ